MKVLSVDDKWLYDVLHNTLAIDSWNGVKKHSLSEAAGYTADLYRVEPIWEGECLPKTLIVKAINHKDLDVFAEMQLNRETNAKLMKAFHLVECQYYDLFNRTYTPVLTPHIYFCSTGTDGKYPPIIVMEDMGKYNTVDMTNGLNQKQLYAVVDELVKLHYYSLTTNDWKRLPPVQLPQAEQPFIDMIKFLLMKLQKENPERFKKADKVLEIFSEVDPFERYREQCAKEPNSVIVHGDLWTANLLWDGNELKGIIDWQQAHCGNIVEDILRVLATTITVQLKRKSVEHLLKYYYEKISERFQQSGRTLPFNFEYVQDSYRRMLPLITAITIFSVAIWAKNNLVAVCPEDENKRISELFDRLEDLINDAFNAVLQEANTTIFYGVKK